MNKRTYKITNTLRIFATAVIMAMATLPATAQTGFDDDVDDEATPPAPAEPIAGAGIMMAIAGGYYLLKTKRREVNS